MELRGKHILLISPDPWEGLKASKHHLAAEPQVQVGGCKPEQTIVQLPAVPENPLPSGRTVPRSSA